VTNKTMALRSLFELAWKKSKEYDGGRTGVEFLLLIFKMAFEKDFQAWSEGKQVLHNTSKRPFFREREIWWQSVGVNVGFEIDGKNKENSEKLFLRPVLVLKKLNHFTFLGVPLTSKEKTGKWYYPLSLKEKKNFLIFSQVRVFDAKRMSHLFLQVSEKEFENIKTAFLNFLA